MKQDCRSLARVLTVGLLALAPVYAQSAAQNSNSANRLASGDHTFVTKAAQGGMAEVKLGTLATQKADNADVKAFGQQMVDDHSKANDELKQLASKKGITLPTDIDSKDQATYDRLSKLSGAEFDRAYMNDMVSDHRKDVSEFRHESQSGSDPDVKAWAAKTLPTLEHHLQMAESTDAKVKK
jgi:putative membrane protein